jgi:Skp family chaperone for outer membrane proteins
MNELNMKLVGKIQEEVISIVEEIAKKGGFTIIMEKGVLLYSGGAIDISDEVVKKYDATSK